MNEVSKTQIEFSETGFFSKLMTDYLNGDTKLEAFYQYKPNLQSFEKAIIDKSKEKIDRATLANSLRNQYGNLSIEGSKVEANINRLEKSNTFTVTTGHQLGLFTGPLYFIYKILSTINLAEKLAAEYPENSFVPVFWMASEDHDFAEINHTYVLGQRLEWESGEKGAVGRMKTEGVQPALDRMTELAGDREHANSLMEMLNTAYKDQKNLTEATRYVVHELFKEYGLIILDGDDADLKKLMEPAFKDELLNGSSFKAIQATNERLGEHYKLQVNPREINLFGLAEGIRERIVKREGERNYELNNTSRLYTEDELLQRLEDHPEEFSPNVVLRPLYQETILPNLAYIGGGGEMAYWFQLKGVFEHHKVNFPMLLLRNSVMWIDGPTTKRMQKLELEITDLFADEDQIIGDFVRKHATEETELDAQKAQVEEVYKSIRSKAEAIDQSLVGAIQAELQKQLKAIDGMEKRLVKAEKRKQETSVNQIRTIKGKLFPGGSLQERHDNFTMFYLKYGSDFIKTLKGELDVLDQRFSVFVEATS